MSQTEIATVGHIARYRTTVLAFAAVLASLGMAGWALATPPDSDVDTIIAEVRDAVGYERFAHHPGGFLLEGVAEHLGDSGEARLMFTQAGQFVKTVSARLSETVGFDGTSGWMIDWMGMPRTLEMRDLETAQASVWVWTARWLADDSPFTVSVITEETDDAQVTLWLRLKGGVFKGKLALDRSTWLPQSLRRRSPSGVDTWTFSKYREFDGIRLAHCVSYTCGSGDTERFDVRSVSAAPDAACSPYEPVTARPVDTSFNPDVPPEIEVKRVRSGHLLVHPHIDDQDLGWFIFDTGAGALVITPAAADAAGMQRFGEIRASGVGSGTMQTGFRSAGSFQLGPMSISDPVFVELDLSFLAPILGVPVAGICGYDLLARCVVELDASDGCIRLFDWADYRLQEGDWTELHIDGQLPHVRARLEGDHAGMFMLDTGYPGTLAFNSPAVRRLDLLQGRRTRVAMIGGAGGVQLARSGTIEWFELAGRRFEHPEATFSLAKRGGTSGVYRLGTIGAELLKPFTIVFNYPQKRIAFVERAAAQE